MKQTFLSFAALAVMAGVWTQPAQAQPQTRTFPHGTSSSGKILWAARPFTDKDGTFQHKYYLYEKDSQDGSGTFLCQSMTVGISFSPDDRWILVQDGGSSLGLHLRLFKRAEGAKYEERKVDLDDAVFKVIAASPDGKNVDVNLLDHTYLSCEGWSEDGKKAVLEMSGHGASNGKRIEINKLSFMLTPEPLKVAPGRPAKIVPGSIAGKPGPIRSPRAGIPQLIQFPAGSKTAQVHGSITPPQKAATYGIKVEKGQHLFLNVIPQKGFSTAGHIKLPSGKEDGGPGGVIFDGEVEETGEYVISIMPHHMAESADQGTFTLEVVLK